MFVGRGGRCIRRVCQRNMLILWRGLSMLRGSGRMLYPYERLLLMHDIGMELAHCIFLSELDLWAVVS